MNFPSSLLFSMIKKETFETLGITVERFSTIWHLVLWLTESRFDIGDEVIHEKMPE
jgi:hypothetical protein